MQPLEQARHYIKNPKELDAALAADVAITNPDDVMVDMQYQASKVVAWSILLTIFEKHESRAKRNLERVEAEARERSREILTASGDKPTVDRIKDTAILNDEVRSAASLLDAASEFVGKIKGTVKALEQHKDMLVQINSRHKAELGHYSRDTELESLKEAARRK